MKHFVLIVLMIWIVLPQEAAAQSTEITYKQRQAFFDAAKLDNTTAVVRTLMLPGLGNFYTEQYFSGVLLMTTYTFGAMSLIYGLLNTQGDALVIGGLIMLGSYGVGLGTSIYGVSEYNTELRRRYNLKKQGQSAQYNKHPAPVGLQLSLAF